MISLDPLLFLNNNVYHSMQILRAIKSRCGSRLKRGDFALTSDALVLAVRDNRSSAGASVAPAAQEQDRELGGDDCGGNRDGEVVAVVELCLRQPDGWLPFNAFFQVRAVFWCAEKQ